MKQQISVAIVMLIAILCGISACQKDSHLVELDESPELLSDFKTSPEDPLEMFLISDGQRARDTFMISRKLEILVKRSIQNDDKNVFLEHSTKSGYQPQKEILKVTGKGFRLVEFNGPEITRLELSVDPQTHFVMGKITMERQNGYDWQFNLRSERPMTEITMFETRKMALIMDTPWPELTAYLLDADKLMDPELTSFRTDFVTMYSRNRGKEILK